MSQAMFAQDGSAPSVVDRTTSLAPRTTLLFGSTRAFRPAALMSLHETGEVEGHYREAVIEIEAVSAVTLSPRVKV